MSRNPVLDFAESSRLLHVAADSGGATSPRQNVKIILIDSGENGLIALLLGAGLALCVAIPGNQGGSLSGTGVTDIISFFLLGRLYPAPS